MPENTMLCTGAVAVPSPCDQRLQHRRLDVGGVQVLAVTRGM